MATILPTPAHRTRPPLASGHGGAFLETQAYRIHRFGGPHVMRIERVMLPPLCVGEAMVRVDAASVNPVDEKIREGMYPLVPEDALPYTLGRDFAGTIEALCGDGFGMQVGDKVFGMLRVERGAYSRRVIAKVGEFTLRPRSLSARDAAALPVAALTAWQGLFDQGRLRSGQRVLIHAAAGGVGHLAVQFARTAGAEIFATATGDGVDFVRGLGADRVIDFNKEAFENAVGDVDLVFDLVGGETQQRSWRVLRPGGALISSVTEPAEAAAEQHGVRAASFIAHPSVTQLDQVRALIDSGRVRVVVQRSFPFERLPDAQRALARGDACGKVVLDMLMGDGAVSGGGETH